eukprot:m.137261 g.137261  ORF g.137261 m.137261 type:complete len:349 (+) comp15889_c3_seq1:463-1509(+)
MSTRNWRIQPCCPICWFNLLFYETLRVDLRGLQAYQQAPLPDTVHWSELDREGVYQASHEHGVFLCDEDGSVFTVEEEDNSCGHCGKSVNHSQMEHKDVEQMPINQLQSAYERHPELERIITSHFSQLPRTCSTIFYLRGGNKAFQASFPRVALLLDQEPQYLPYPQRLTHELFSRIFIGGQGAASSSEVLYRLNITHIVNCTPQVPHYFEAGRVKTGPRGEQTVAAEQQHKHSADGASTKVRPLSESLHIQYLRVPAIDDDVYDISAHFDQTNAFLDQALTSSPDHLVLVHCHQGKSRSVAILAAFVMWRLRVDPATAVAHIRAARPLAQPNAGFMRALHHYWKALS